MKLDNARYEKQMVSVDACLFSIRDNGLSVLLLKREMVPHQGLWSLPGGGVYNDETCEDALKRELKEKLDVSGITPFLANVFSNPKRDERFRNISISYYGMVAGNKFNFGLGIEWFPVTEVPKLAFDHNSILESSLRLLRERIYDISFMKKFLPSPFALGQLQFIYESILGHPLDKRNFRRKLNALACLVDTGIKNESDPRRKSTLYKFK